MRKGVDFINKKEIRVKCSDLLHDELKNLSTKKGVPMATLVKFALWYYLRKENNYDD